MAQPTVAVVTPVYNGGEYLAECIESVLNQDYKDIQYVVVNNCSTDTTLEISQRYASRDSRIRIVNNSSFVGVIENHNIAFSQIPETSKYCKVVSADDWIYAECLTRLVELADKHPTVGVVGSYTLRTDQVRGIGIAPKRQFIPGREAGKLRLLGSDVIGSPTSLLFRADLVRQSRPFFVGSSPHADIDACLRVLQDHDYGFVHQILSFERVQPASVSASIERFNSFLCDQLEFLLKYGHVYLTSGEREERRQELMETYYNYLAVAVVNAYDEQFWNYHRERLRGMGLKLDYRTLLKSTAAKVVNLGLNPKLMLDKALGHIRRKQNV